MSSIDVAHRAVRQAADSPWADRMARLGFCARGVVYGIVGVIALQVAWTGGQGDEASKEGALREIAERPMSGLLLTTLAAGLAGYALWRASEAAWGKRDESDERTRTFKRVVSATKAAIYVGLLVSTVRFIRGGPAEASGTESEESWTASALELPAGRWLVSAVALVVMASAAHIAHRGLSQKFDTRLDTSEMGPVTGRAIDVLGTVGLAAKGGVFGLLGYLLLRAALDYDPDEASGLDGTLKVIASQPYGQALLTTVAVGLVAYGLYSFAEARYRQL